jgi:hypothetical protein
MVNKSLRHFCLLGGLGSDPNMVFTLSSTIIGSERFEYFKVLVVEERRMSDIACTFPRRSTHMHVVSIYRSGVNDHLVSTRRLTKQSRHRSPTSPPRTAKRYFVVQTT